MINIGFYYILLTKKSELSKVIIVTIVAFLFPIVMYFALSSQLNIVQNPFNNTFATCSLNPCFEYIISSDNVMLINQFNTLYQQNFQPKKQSYQVVNNLSILEQNILETNQGHYKFGIFINSQSRQVHIYTKSKQNNLIINDNDVVQSPLLPLMQIINQITAENDTIVGPKINFNFTDLTSKEIYETMKVTQLSIFSNTYLVLSINTIVSFALLKDKNVYDYLIICGLDKLKFFGGIAGYIILEMTIASIILMIIYQALHITDITIINMLVPILSLIPSLQYMLCFSYFIFCLCKSIKSIIPMYIILGFIPTQGLMVIYAVTNVSNISGFKILKGFFQFLFPGISSSYVLENAQYIMQQQHITFGSFLTIQSSKTYNNIIINLISIISGMFYVLLGILVDNCASYHSHPTYPLKVLFKKQKQVSINQHYSDYITDIPQCQIKAVNLSKQFTVHKNKSNTNVAFNVRCCSNQKISALKNINLQLQQENDSGKIIGVVGSNASGKSTLFKLITQLLKPNSGTLNVQFNDQKLHSLVAKQEDQTQTRPEVQLTGKKYFNKLAVVFQENVILRTFNVLDMAGFIYRVMNSDKNLSRQIVLEEIQRFLAQMGLEKCLKQKLPTLSGGQLKRLNVVYSMCRKNPCLRILDEPACGVDIESRKWLWRHLRQCNKGLTLITTHLIEEVEELCDEVVFLKEGQLVITGSLEQVKETLSDGYKLEFEDQEVEKEELDIYLSSLNVQKYSIYGNKFVSYVFIGFNDDDKIHKILQKYQYIKVTCPNVTEIFTKIEGETFEQQELI